MKKILFSIAAACALAGPLQAATIILSGTLGTTTNLSTDNCYKLRGCVIVPNGATLNIAAGVQIRAEADAALVIDKGGTINALGSATAPIVFTSDQATGSRTPGHWVGIAVVSDATNNNGSLPMDRCGTTYTGGGTNNTANSGTIRFTRIEYAGGNPGGTTLPGALVLISVGSGTTLHHIQVAESANDGYKFFGGKVNATFTASYNAHAADYYISEGYTGKMQFVLGMRLDPNAHVGTGLLSNGMIIENNPSSTTATPFSKPTISNLSILGPNYCDEDATVHSDFQNGIYFRNNGQADIRNSAVAGWPQNGLFIVDANSVANTASNLLNVSYTAIVAATAGAQFGNGFTWSGTGCGSSMAVWISGASPTTCSESSNDLSLSGFDYSSTICGDYCNTASPDLAYSGSDLENTNFSAPFNDAFFTPVDYKGALQTADWAAGWAEWCPQSASYCSFESPKARAAGAEPIGFAPNPASGLVTATFTADGPGHAQLSVLDKVSGAVLVSKEIRMTAAGEQSISFSVDRLREGVYPVMIKTNHGALQGKLVVK